MRATNLLITSLLLYTHTHIHADASTLPPIVGKECVVEGGGNDGRVGRGAFHWVVVVLRGAAGEVEEAHHDDHNERQHLSQRQGVLYRGGPTHALTVDVGEGDCRGGR